MSTVLGRVLAREQRAFLGRDRGDWAQHLGRVRGFLGEGLARADRVRPVLVLGAGSGLEVPWAIAPPHTWGWDADPWSRLRTALRHRRFPPWRFDDFSGGFVALDDLARRCAREPWGARPRRAPEQARRRCAGLLASLDPQPVALAQWLAAHRPGTILSANVLGQLGVLAQRILGARLGAWWEEAFPPEELDDALEAWTARILRRHLALLAGSGAALWLVHDRGVVHGAECLELGPWTEPWPGQLRGRGQAELEDPLAGVDVLAELEAAGRPVQRRERWLWPLAPGQVHLVEALGCF